MIENELADRFRSALSNEPPLGFNPDEVVDRAERLRRRRMTTFAASATAATVVLAAVTALQLVRTDDGQLFGAGTTPTSEPSKPDCGPVKSGVPSPKPTGTKPTQPKPTGTRRSDPVPSDPLPSNPQPSDPQPSDPEPSDPGPGESKPVPTGSKPVETEPTKPTETRPTGKPTVTKPVDPCEPTKIRPTGPAANEPEIIKKVQVIAPELLGGAKLELVEWKADVDARMVVAVFRVAGTDDPLRYIQAPTQAGGEPGTLLSETTNADGSRLKVYQLDDGTVGVQHLRTNGVAVEVDGLLPQQQLTALATDGRPTF